MLSFFELSKNEIFILFSIKVICSVLFGLFSFYIFKGDTLGYYRASVMETDMLLNEPNKYLKSIFEANGRNMEDFIGTNSYWNYIRYSFFGLKLVLVNILTKENFYTQQLIFATIAFIGHLSFFKIFQFLYKGQKWLNITVAFLLPSALFFTAGVQKDSLIFFAIGIVFLSLIKLFETTCLKKWRWFLSLTMGLILILFYRNFFFLSLMPILLSMIIIKKTKLKFQYVYFFIILISTIGFFLTGNLKNSLNMPQKVLERRQAFEMYSYAKSYIPKSPMYNNWQSFMSNLPQAFNHALMRPYPNEIKVNYYLPVVIENIFIFIIFFIFLLNRNKIKNKLEYFEWAIIIYALISIIFIGYTITVAGAIARYRSVFLLFLLMPILSRLKWEGLFTYYKNKYVN